MSSYLCNAVDHTGYREARFVSHAISLVLLTVACTLYTVMPVFGAEDKEQASAFDRAKAIYRNQLQIIHDETARKYDAQTRSYVRDLDGMETIFRERGELQGVLAARGEKNRIMPQPHSNVVMVSPLPDELARLRAAHEEQRQAVAVAEAEAIQALVQRYTAHLENIKRDLTRRDLLEEALAVETEIHAVRGSSDFKAAQALLPAPESKPQAETSAVASDLQARLKAIRIPEFRFNSYNPSIPLNELINYFQPHQIQVRVEQGVLPVSYFFVQHENRPRYFMSYQSAYRRPELRREVSLTDTTGLVALQAVCDVFGLGYSMEHDSVIFVTPDDPRASWSRPSLRANVVSSMFADNNAQAVEYFKDKPVRITGMLSSMTRGVAGNTVAVIETPRPIRIEFGSDTDPAQLAAMQEAFRRIQEHIARAARRPDAPRTVRRMGEQPTPVAPAAGGPTITISVTGEYQSQMGLTIRFTNGRDLVWQQNY